MSLDKQSQNYFVSRRPARSWIGYCTCFLLLTTSGSVSGQERWFQVEVSIFSNENMADRNEERWLPGSEALSFPDPMRRLGSLMDILLIDALLPADDASSAPGQEPATSNESSQTTANNDTSPLVLMQQRQQEEARQRAELVSRVGPPVATTGSGFRFYDLERDSFLQLPAAQSDFQQTNRRLQQSPEHRLLFHGLWRQPMLDPGEATPIFISGGEQFGDFQELMGTVEVRFNEARDRIVLDADLWLSEFATIEIEDNDWMIPTPPEQYRSASQQADDTAFNYYPAQVYHMRQSREMRSTEFHYMDHPAIGIVVLVEPYELPEAPPPGFTTIDVIDDPDVNIDGNSQPLP